MCPVTGTEEVKRQILSPFIKQCFVTAAVCSNVVCGGCIVGFPGVMLPQLQQGGSSISVSEDQASWLASVAAMTSIFGAFFITPVMSRVGRKVAHYVVILVSLLGWMVPVLATNYEVLLLGRFVQGLSFGMFLPLRSVVIGELTSPRHRGGFLSAISLTHIFGILFVHGVGSLLSYQMTAVASISFLVISFVLMIFSPESPSWLATQGRFDECRRNFMWLRGEDESPEVDKMIQVALHLRHQNQEECNLKGITAVVKRKEFHKPIFLMFVLYIMHTCSGTALFGAYSVPILKVLMGTDVDAYFWMVLIDFQRLFFSGLSVYVIHKVKRRRLLFATGAVCAGSQLSIAANTFAKSNGYCLSSLWLPKTLLSLQIMALSIGTNPLPSVIAGEVLPLQHRGLAGSIGLIAYSGSNFILVKNFPDMTYLMGFHGAYALYAGMIAACLVVTWFLLPETSGRTLQQIEEHFRGEPLRDPEADSKETEPLRDAQEAKKT